MQRVYYLIYCILRMRTERWKEEKDISGEVENLERTKDGTNKIRDMSKRAN